MKRYSNVDDYIARSPYKSELQVLRDIVLEAGLIETVKWGSPVYTFDGKNVVGLGSFKSYFGLWFFQGALLEDPGKKLINAQEGKTKALRQWRFNSVDDVDPKLITEYISESIDNQNKGISIKPGNKPLVIPQELSRALEENNLNDIFNDLLLTNKREFAEYISDVKKEETKKKRLEKIIPMMKSGVGLNDKYR